jgi:threonylcarbamoyladenosine tRNA methylthiotransferase MtaB
MTPAPTVAFSTLGCRLNQVDTRQLQARLEHRGFRTVPFGTRADVVVVNTCTVTARAELSDRQAIRRARRGSPDARLVVTGCWAQTNPGDVAGLGGVDLVVGNADKPRLPDLVATLLAGPRAAPRVEVGDIAAARIEPPISAGRVDGRSRAFVKVQDGCQHRCAFCVVPLARGASRSLPGEVIEDQVRRLVEAGHPEVVLTGVDLGHWGTDLTPRTSLAALLERLVQLPGLRWLRLSSMLPAYFTEAVLDTLTSAPAIAPHFHLPLQSGSDRILRRMRRPYTVAMYRRVVERLATAIPAWVWALTRSSAFPARPTTTLPPRSTWSPRCRCRTCTCFRTPCGAGPRRPRGRSGWPRPPLPPGLAGCAAPRPRRGWRFVGAWSGASRTCWCCRRAIASPAISLVSPVTSSR